MGHGGRQVRVPADLLKGNERGSVSGNPRRVAEFSWSQLRRSARLNGATDLALTFADYIDARNRGMRRFSQLTDKTIEMVCEMESVAAAPVSFIRPASMAVALSTGGYGRPVRHNFVNDIGDYAKYALLRALCASGKPTMRSGCHLVSDRARRTQQQRTQALSSSHGRMGPSRPGSARQDEADRKQPAGSGSAQPEPDRSRASYLPAPRTSPNPYLTYWEPLGSACRSVPPGLSVRVRRWPTAIWCSLIRTMGLKFGLYPSPHHSQASTRRWLKLPRCLTTAPALCCISMAAGRPGQCRERVSAHK